MIVPLAGHIFPTQTSSSLLMEFLTEASHIYPATLHHARTMFPSFLPIRSHTGRTPFRFGTDVIVGQPLHYSLTIMILFLLQRESDV